MFPRQIFIFELNTVDGFTAGSIADGEISTLDHKAWDDAMEDAVGISERQIGVGRESLFARAERSEVLGRLGNLVLVELKDDALGVGTAEGDVEVCNDPRSAPGKEG